LFYSERLNSSDKCIRPKVLKLKTIFDETLLPSL